MRQASLSNAGLEKLLSQSERPLFIVPSRLSSTALDIGVTFAVFNVGKLFATRHTMTKLGRFVVASRMETVNAAR